MPDTPPEADRGALHPHLLPVDFRRRVPVGHIRQLVRWFWMCTWTLPEGETSRQQILPFPHSNLVVEPEMVGLSGPTAGVSHRDLVGTGWVVACVVQPAALASLCEDPVSIRDRYISLSQPELHREVTDLVSARRIATATEVLERWLTNRVGTPSEDALLANRMLDMLDAGVDIRSVPEHARMLSVSVRTLHRLAARHVGLTPHAILRRHRLQLAAHRLRMQPTVTVAQAASDAGYSDHSHFSREFRRVIGCTPTDYRRRLAHGTPSP